MQKFATCVVQAIFEKMSLRHLLLSAASSHILPPAARGKIKLCFAQCLGRGLQTLNRAKLPPTEDCIMCVTVCVGAKFGAFATEQCQVASSAFNYFRTKFCRAHWPALLQLRDVPNSYLAPCIRLFARRELSHQGASLSS